MEASDEIHVMSAAANSMAHQPTSTGQDLSQEIGPKIRIRRTRSSSKVETIVTEDEKIRRSQPDKPIHKPRDSIFSWRSGFQNFEGMINWAFLLLTMGGVRLCLENLNKYGIRVDPNKWLFWLFGNSGSDQGSESPIVFLLLFTNVPVLLTLAVEKAMAAGWLVWSVSKWLHIINMTMVLGLPAYIINHKYDHIGPGFQGIFVFITAGYVVLFMKLLSYVQTLHWLRSDLRLPQPPLAEDKVQDIAVNGTFICANFTIILLKMLSYVQVNSWCRRSVERGQIGSGRHRSHKTRHPSLYDLDSSEYSSSLKPRGRKAGQELVQYPDNLTVRDIYYFWFAPTLCYELNFPRSGRVRKMFLLRRALEVLVGTNLVLALIQQWIIPSVVNSLLPFSNMNLSLATERLLKLALPNHLIWLTWFYLTFHSFLNTMGEILQFADRNFYADWWNANNVMEFWKMWNLPVHNWCVRHLYKPLVVDMKLSKLKAQIAVFIVSALLHEYLVSVPLRIFKVYAFVGMVLQVPLMYLSLRLQNTWSPRMGNLLVWMSLIIGQPLAVMMYYHDFVVEHYGKELLASYGQLK